jgi:hypothetical protein
MGSKCAPHVGMRKHAYNVTSFYNIYVKILRKLKAITLSPCSTVLLDKLIVSHVVRNSCILPNLKVLYHVQNSLPMDHNLSHTNLVHTFTFHLRTHFNIIFPSKCGYPKRTALHAYIMRAVPPNVDVTAIASVYMRKYADDIQCLFSEQTRTQPPASDEPIL